LALINAASNGHTDTVRALFEIAGATISAHAKGWALTEAARAGHTDTVRALLELAVGINMLSEVTRGYLLCNAASNGHTETVRALCEEPGLITNFFKGRALNCAALKGHEDVVKMIDMHLKAREVLPQKIYACTGVCKLHCVNSITLGT
jgi:ankyrin repeat protein